MLGVEQPLGRLKLKPRPQPPRITQLALQAHRQVSTWGLEIVAIDRRSHALAAQHQVQVAVAVQVGQR